MVKKPTQRGEIHLWGFISHTGESNQQDQQGETSADPMDSLYRDVLTKERQQASSRDSQTESHLSHDPLSNNDQSKEACEQSETGSNMSEQQLVRDRQENPPLPAPTHIDISQPIGRLRGAAEAGSVGPLTVRGALEEITDEEILKNRESEEGIRNIPRFRNYDPGTPSKVEASACESHDHHHSAPAGPDSVYLTEGVVREEPEHTGVCGPARGAVLPV